MSCSKWEADIALWVEGDLASDELERHLADCAGCRQFADEMRASQGALHSLAEAEIPSTRVRAYVLAEIERRRRTRWTWWAVPAAALASLLLLMLPARGPEPERIQVKVWTPPVPPASAGQRPAPPHEPQFRLARGGAGFSLPKAETSFIRMETEDDNVVILWITENEGERP